MPREACMCIGISMYAYRHTEMYCILYFLPFFPLGNFPWISIHSDTWRYLSLSSSLLLLFNIPWICSPLFTRYSSNKYLTWSTILFQTMME